jgi:hypothetical protein
MGEQMGPATATKNTGNLKPSLVLQGKTFGLWYVLHRVANGPKRGTKWLCQCECKNERIVYGSALVRGRSKSCGCDNPTRFKKQLHGGSVAANCAVSNYRTSALARGHLWELSYEACYSLFSSRCHWCGSPPSNVIFAGKRRQHKIVYNGIDRVDNRLGYTLSNVVSCCKICNRAKNTLTVEEFKSWINQLVKHVTQ